MASIRILTRIVGTGLLIFLIFAEFITVKKQTIALKQCKQCVLFGRIFEVKRALEGGSYAWCYIVVVNGFLSIVVCILLILQCFGYSLGIHLPTSLTQSTKWTIFCATISNVFTIFIVTTGWQAFCSTFTVTRCYITELDLIDWYSFTPQYSDCAGTSAHYHEIQVMLWICSALWPILLFGTYKGTPALRTSTW